MHVRYTTSRDEYKELFLICNSSEGVGTDLTKLPMPIVPKEKKTKSRKSHVSSSNSILELPLPAPPTSSSTEPIEPVEIKKPSICGLRMHEYNSEHDDWGSQFVENYELGDVIGEGTFGQVFKARDKRTDKVVALKKVRLDKEREGFPVTTVREIKILRQLDDHENIIKLREIVTDKLIVTDYRKWKVPIMKGI